MYLIIGLGNPEEEYAKTRHNMGFDTINKIGEENSIEITKSKFKSLYGTGIINGEKVVLVKPQTYMNLSGHAVREFVNFYKLEPKDIVVIYDDMDIEPGVIKIRKKGGPGSHNGMKSIVENLSTEEFTRIRIGIGKPIHNDKVNYVIGRITSEEEYDLLQQGVRSATKAINSILKEGIESTMNKFN